MFGLGGLELLFLLLLGLLFFGAGRLAQIGTSLGRIVHAFRQGAADARAIEVEPLRDDEPD